MTNSNKKSLFKALPYISTGLQQKTDPEEEKRSA